MTDTLPGPDIDVGALQRALGLSMSEPELLGLAVTHRSYAFEAGGLPTNERLEFLGDAVLGIVITDDIYHRFPDAPEGRLAKVRAAAVNTQSLASVARELDLGSHVLLGRGEQQSGGRDKDSILADTLEAVLGAVYLGEGLPVASQLIRRLFGPLLDTLATRHASLDYKTSLQELTAAELAALPVYVLDEEGPDHAKRFTAVVEIDGEALGRGLGRSKKEAEQAAAQQAYAALQARLAVVSPPPEGMDGDTVGGTR